ncbi:MAG: dethiobiotin synthase [Terriglobales bacterium]
MKRQSYFITGTDTGVGKTVVSSLLTLGLEANYWKPMQCGTEGPPGAATDTECVARWTGLPRQRFLPEAYRFALPASPHLAAAREHQAIRLRRLRLPPSARPLIVEGAGGILVPLNRRTLMVDLMAQLGMPVVVVARARLGTINHTLMSLEALRARHLAIAGVVINDPPGEAEGEGVAANVAAIRRYGQVRILAVLPLLAALTPRRLRAAWRSFTP